jgi:hypothetical protein
MSTIQYIRYRFNRPPLVATDDYEILKIIKFEIPEFIIYPSSIFVETFLRKLFLLDIGAICFFNASLDLTEPLNWLRAEDSPFLAKIKSIVFCLVFGVVFCMGIAIMASKKSIKLIETVPRKILI